MPVCQGPASVRPEATRRCQDISSADLVPTRGYARVTTLTFGPSGPPLNPALVPVGSSPKTASVRASTRHRVRHDDRLGEMLACHGNLESP